jgi:cobalt/nickel transport system permease protein
MIVERFSEGHSFFHILDPRVKICFAFPLVFAVALSEKLIVAGICLFIAVCFVIFSRLKLKHLATNLRVLLVFLILLWIFLPFSMPGNIIYRIGPFNLSYNGILKAFSITLKSVTIVLYIITLLSTSSVNSLVHGMSHLLVPKKLIYLAFLSYRYIQVLYVEYKKLFNAIKMRGFKPKTDLHTYKTFAYFAGMLLIRSYDRSERIQRAMICRGFHGNFYLLDHFSINRKDVIFSIFAVLIFSGVIWLEWITKIL